MGLQATRMSPCDHKPEGHNEKYIKKEDGSKFILPEAANNDRHHNC
jgi:hypothetical protein